MVAMIRGGFHKLRKKQKAMADEVEGVGISVIDDIEHLLLQSLTGFLIGRRIDGRGAADSSQPQAFLCPQTVKFDPGIFPRLLFIRAVGGDLSGNDQNKVF